MRKWLSGDGLNHHFSATADDVLTFLLQYLTEGLASILVIVATVQVYRADVRDRFVSRSMQQCANSNRLATAASQVRGDQRIDQTVKLWGQFPGSSRKS